MKRWVIQGHGTTAEAGRRLALQHPERVEALVLDSLVTDPVVADDEVVERVAMACRADHACKRTYGDPARAWASPRPEWLAGPGRRRRRHADLDRLRHPRARRPLVAGPVEEPSQLPALLAEAAAGRPGEQSTLSPRLWPRHRHCASATCRSAPASRPAIGAVLSAMPDGRRGGGVGCACKAWVGGLRTGSDPAGRSASPRAVRRSRPVRQPERHSRPARRAGAGRLRRRLRERGHNVLGSDCPRSVRSPGSPATSTSHHPSSRPASPRRSSSSAERNRHACSPLRRHRRRTPDRRGSPGLHKRHDDGKRPPVPESSATTSSPTAEADGSASTAPTEGTYDGPTIPEGMYTVDLTRAEAERAANMHGPPRTPRTRSLASSPRTLPTVQIEGASGVRHRRGRWRGGPRRLRHLHLRRGGQLGDRERRHRLPRMRDRLHWTLEATNSL